MEQLALLTVLPSMNAEPLRRAVWKFAANALARRPTLEVVEVVEVVGTSGSPVSAAKTLTTFARAAIGIG